MISKFAGGLGVYVGKIRGKGSSIQNYKGACSGVIPVIRLINDTTVYVDQLGMRKGSASITLDIWHYDILDFLEVKTTHGDERLKAHDIFPAVSIPDLFMKRLKKFLETNESQEWTLFDPYSVRHYL
jgi:ribonucleoside-diphosphate reductase alpha chain